MDHEPHPKSDSLRFKPLNSGLGFHPFSEGLPYSTKNPSTKPEMKSGTGAVSAGAPRFAFPVKKPEMKTAPATKPVAKPTVVELKNLDINESSASLKDLSLRFVAYLIDMSFNFAVTLGLLVLAQAGSPSISIKDLIFGDFSLILLLAFFILNYVLVAAQELIFHTSIGKSFFGFGLKGTTGQVILRSMFFVPSVFFGGLGILWCFFDSERMCWHDRASGLAPKRYS